MLAGLLSADPQTTAGGTNATYWTVAMLTLGMIVRLGSYLCPATLRRSLHRLRLRWGRPRLAMPEKLDPEKARKQWAIAEAMLSAGPDTVVLYADESRVQTLPLVRALWHWVGQQVRIPTPGSNVSRAIFGALEWRTGRWTYLVREHMRADDSSPFSNTCCKPMGPVRSS